MDFDSGDVKLDATALALRAFNIRLSTAERLIASAARIAAQSGRDGKDGQQGPRGPQGPEGPPGPPPEHRWEGTSLQFRQPSGEWGERVDLQGPKGDGKTMVGVVQTAPTVNSWEPSGW